MILAGLTLQLAIALFALPAVAARPSVELCVFAFPHLQDGKA